MRSRADENKFSFLKTYLAAIRIIHEEPAVAKRALARYLTKDSAMIDDSYRRLSALFLKVPYMPEEAIRSVLAVSDHPALRPLIPWIF
jgi:hypothetical protein